MARLVIETDIFDENGNFINEKLPGIRFPTPSDTPEGYRPDFLVTREDNVDIIQNNPESIRDITKPTVVNFNTTIPFNRLLSVMHYDMSVSGAILATLEPLTLNPIPGAQCLLTVIADGTNLPAFSTVFKKHTSSGNFVSIAGRFHEILFTYNGQFYTYTISDTHTIALPDTTAPTIVNRTATSPTNIRVVFNEAMGTLSVAGHTFNNGSIVIPSAVTLVSGNTYDFTVAGLSNGQTITHSYDSTTGNTTDVVGNELVTFTAIAVTNSISISYDTNAESFFTASGISDPTQKNAVNQLVLDLKTAGVWNKTYALYPFVGSTNSSHKWNLKDPRDLDAAYRLTFTGGLTHGSNGITPDGTTGYANTYFNPSTSLSAGSGHLSYLSLTNNATAAGTVMGSADLGNGQYRMQVGDALATAVMSNSTGTDYIVYDHTGSNGFFVSNILSNGITLDKNGTALSSSSSGGTGTGFPNVNMILFAYSSTGTPTEFTDKVCGLTSFGAALSSGERTAFNTAVQAFKTALGR